MYSIFTKYSNYYTQLQNRPGYFLLELVLAILFFSTSVYVVVTLFAASSARYATARRYIEATNYAMMHIETWYSNTNQAAIQSDPLFHLDQEIYTDQYARYITITVSFTAGDGSPVSLPFFGCKGLYSERV